MKALVAAALVTAMVFACGGSQKPDHNVDKRNTIIGLWTQIREYRRLAHMDLDSSPVTQNAIRFKNVKDAERVCVDNHKVTKTCEDVCGLSDAICDNAESICNIADELGKDDDFAQGKCTDAKASCREAKQKCCGCSAEPSP